MSKGFYRGKEPAVPVLTPSPSNLMTQHDARQYGFTGNTCSSCGSMMMVRNGTCEKCTACGTTTGCS